MSRWSRFAVCCIAACHAIPDAPSAIAYDREACTHCHMLIGDARFAVQLVTDAGDVLDFDDPGCALRYVAEAHPAIHRLWFRDRRRDAWTASAEVRFVLGIETPMGYGLAADAAGTVRLDEAATLVAGTAR
jgi:hypothetical protein